MTATDCPLPIPGWTVMNRLVKSSRCSQVWAMRSSAAAWWAILRMRQINWNVRQVKWDRT